MQHVLFPHISSINSSISWYDRGIIVPSGITSVKRCFIHMDKMQYSNRCDDCVSVVGYYMVMGTMIVFFKYRLLFNGMIIVIL